MELNTRNTCLFLLLGTGILFFWGVQSGCSDRGNALHATDPVQAGSGGASQPGRANASGQALYTQYCGTCHLKPEPGSLTKAVWKDKVLPFMGVLMGLPSAIDSFNFSADKDRDVLKRPGNYTGHPLMSEADWSAVKEYLIAASPDSLPYDRQRQTRNKLLTRFTRQDIALDSQRKSLITGLGYDAPSHTLWVGDLYKRLFTWQWNKGIVSTQQTHSPVVDFDFYKGATYMTEIGMILPTEQKRGSFGVVRTPGGGLPSPATGYDGFSAGDSLLLTDLHRPVQSKMEDLDGDGIPEILVCNFGNYSGSLSLFKKDPASGRYTEQILLPMPGAVKCYVRDMDGDGKKDIVALFAQADESVYIFYQRGPLQFEARRVLRFPPDYGTTDLALVDYDHDGLPDLVTVHGDNADYSRILKPYHGIRVHINQGKKSNHSHSGDGSFQEKFFYPLYGVTHVVADDFDKDGDIDFVATAFYADYSNPQDESFVYLENQDAASFRFTSYTLPGHLPIKSFAMEEADINGDGYPDIILGNFSQSPTAVPDGLEAAWQGAPYGLTMFLNQSLRLRKRK